MQKLPFMKQYKYYMRMDDDSLLVSDLVFDPFKRMESAGLKYAFRRDYIMRSGKISNCCGKDELWDMLKDAMPKRIRPDSGRDLPWIVGDRYNGGQPYNNFHVTEVAFWSTPFWNKVWDIMERGHAFQKHRVGDANVHAMAVLSMEAGEWERWPAFEYRHNSNDMGMEAWGVPEWQQECDASYETHYVEADWKAFGWQKDWES
jgi:alpha 1,2-mannosyltransferase